MEKGITIKSQNTVLGLTVRLIKLFSSFGYNLLFFLIWLLGIASLLVLASNFYVIHESHILGLGYLFLAIFLVYYALRVFYIFKLKRPKVNLDVLEAKLLDLNKNPNIFPYFDLDLAESVCQTLTTQPKSADYSLFVATVKSNKMELVLQRIGISSQVVIDCSKNSFSPVDLREIIRLSVENAKKFGHQNIWAGDVFLAFLQSQSFLNAILKDLKLNVSDIEHLLFWQTTKISKYEEKNDALDPNNIKLTGGFGKDWSYGYTNFLRLFSRDITEDIKRYGQGLEIIGRDSQVRQIEEALLSQQNGNVVVVGDDGIGKRTTVLGFAKRVTSGDIAEPLAYKHIFELNTEAVLAEESIADLTNNFSKILSQASYAGNVIIFIEGIDKILSSEKVGRLDLSEILLPYLDSGEVHIIGTCDVDGYNDFILANTALAERFSKVTIKEPSENDLLKILEETLPIIESRTGSVVSYEALKETISLADKYILNIPNPEKSISLLDGAVTKTTSQKGKTIILPEDIEAYITEKYDIPSRQVLSEEKDKLLNLETEMHRSVIGQDEAINALANALRRARADISTSKKPVGSFLFLGPTGVGKTATAKSLAKTYFGKETDMIRFDMTEYQNTSDIYRLIGQKGVKSSGSLVTKVREKPFSLLLFDEIEKANPEILNVFLQILDEGFLTDVEGKKVSFQNSIIIMTSNAGADQLHEAIKTNAGYQKVKDSLVDYTIKSSIFKPEFINRFNAAIVFSPLTEAEIYEIAKIKIANLCQQILDNRGVDLKIEDEAIRYLAKIGFDPRMGARPMDRVIEDKIENMLAKSILKDELKKGDSLTINLKMIQ